MRLTEVTQTWLAEILKEGDAAVDATLGNGFDALFLAQHIGATGQLFGFDVQKQAIQQTRQLLKGEPCAKTFFLKGHEEMMVYLPPEMLGRVNAIMFNLGWLPNSDKSIITKPTTTITALQQSLDYLAVGGRLSVLVYPGHQGGEQEAKQVIMWLEESCANNTTFNYQQTRVPQRPTAPVLLTVEKLSESL